MRRLVLVLCVALCASPGAAAAGEAQRIDAAVAEASAAFGLPEAWIRRVMARESANQPHAVSPAGAMGLMQLMPRTWAEVRARLGLGHDPFDVRDNILAGSAYLRQMLDRFGHSGFLAAYNAGPGRYADVLAGRASLPRETRKYVADLTQDLGAPAERPLRWQAAPLAPRPAGLFPDLEGTRP